MKKQLFILALSLTAFAAPAPAGTAVANVVQVTPFGNNSSSISQSARNLAVASVAQATIRGSTSSISQHARNMGAGVAQEPCSATTCHISQSSLRSVIIAILIGATLCREPSSLPARFATSLNAVSQLGLIMRRVILLAGLVTLCR